MVDKKQRAKTSGVDKEGRTYIMADNRITGCPPKSFALILFLCMKAYQTEVYVYVYVGGVREGGMVPIPRAVYREEVVKHVHTRMVVKRVACRACQGVL